MGRGFPVDLAKHSDFTAGLAIGHAVLPKEQWLADVGVQAEWPCWGEDAHNPLRQRQGVSRHSDRPGLPGSRYRHRSPPAARTALWRSYRTRGRDPVNRARRLKSTTFSNVEQKGDYESEGLALLNRTGLEK